jgi:hypothetical protein
MIDGACEGKNAWDDILKSMAPHELDVYIVHVKDQTPLTWQHFELKWTHFSNIKTIPCAKRV